MGVERQLCALYAAGGAQLRGLILTEPLTENTPRSSGSAGILKGMLLKAQLSNLPVFLWRSLVLSGNFSHSDVSIQDSSSCLTQCPSNHWSSGISLLQFWIPPTANKFIQKQVLPCTHHHPLYHSPGRLSSPSPDSPSPT